MTAKKTTITEAIIEVLQKQNRPLSLKEICKQILEENIYTFKTANPEHVIGNQLRRHCENIKLNNASSKKHFIRLDDGTYFLKKATNS